jgi:hypothetical protein
MVCDAGKKEALMMAQRAKLVLNTLQQRGSKGMQLT